MEFMESETTELKSVYVDEIKKEIIAFANSAGGSLYIGVRDDGTVCGVENADEVIQRVTNAARDAIKPDVMMFVRCRRMIEDDRTVVAVEVGCGAHRPYYLAAKGLRPEGVYVRQGTSSVPASEAAIRRMIRETDGDNFEEMRSLEQDLTFETARAEFARCGLELRETQMRTLGLVDREGLHTNLGLLLSDQCPHIIKAATFAGIDQEQFQDRREFSGSLLRQLNDAYEYLDLRNQNRATFDGLHRTDNRDYPPTAIREALLNAIVHRDYSVMASTLIGVYADRVEFLSIGGLAGDVSYEDIMIGVSFCRNRRLAELFYRLGLIEAYGTGMQKILNSYRGTEKQPEILVTSGAFKVILSNRNDGWTNGEDAADAGAAHVRTEKRMLTKNEEAVLNLLADGAELTRAEIGAALKLSTATACRLVKELVGEGRLIAIPSGRAAKYRKV